VICPTCHGKGNDWALLTQQYITCMDCNGSGIAYCCDDAGNRSLNQGRVTQGVSKMLAKIEYNENTIAPDQTGWYIKEYSSIADLQNEIPCDVIGPYATQAAARRALATPDENEETETPKHGVSNRKPYDPARDPTPARSTEASEAGDVHMELQQVEELRDLPEALQGD
jgi:hypothetical protein